MLSGKPNPHLHRWPVFQHGLSGGSTIEGSSPESYATLLVHLGASSHQLSREKGRRRSELQATGHTVMVSSGHVGRSALERSGGLGRHWCVCVCVVVRGKSANAKLLWWDVASLYYTHLPHLWRRLPKLAVSNAILGRKRPVAPLFKADFG